MGVHGLPTPSTMSQNSSAGNPRTAAPRAERRFRRPAAKKSLGQNFLVDSRVARRIVSEAEVSENDTVLEIGPGRGALTTRLAETAKRLIAVELDDDLAPRLSEKYAAATNVEIVHDDAREVQVNALLGPGERYKLVANLPYNAANPIIRKFLTSKPAPSVMVVMVQREVARSMAARPGDMGLLSVMIQLYGAAKVAFSVPPRAFKPAPKVTSAVVRIDVYDSPALSLDSHERFIKFAAAGFRAPRKQLRNSLKTGLGAPADAVDTLLESAGIDPKRRPATLSIDEWGALYDLWRQNPDGSDAIRGPDA
ncbi:MAG: ribosomal RNA small subunit methyltransferase A [SAR202 cluster bacterium]|nr:ribosomal RNA small subunit methyltransferase A [Chloroflexota bacterium]MQG58018.1 ribosomal RNA small subunit methyltransferase A [SAR202 cluster bacterium]MQG68450.1 ribosomal RNA small subunit methyltransferase A [SAR202 cluster bacterium]HAL46311.1 ribosomal RNA small subunit methyltransferase A [Dehalococcoidia bacterium]